VLTLRVSSAEDLKQLGRAVGQALRAGDLVALVGPLGAGKTTLTQGLAVGLGVPSERHVASPTFALVNEHPGRVPLVHADLYRLKDEAELAELGLDENATEVVRVIEWADKFGDHWAHELSPDALTIRIAFVEGTGEGRTLHISGTPLAEPRFAAFRLSR
jgi:tRNA threonylcarbamoyladenosine biosynthesis protein TsaE